MKRRALNFICLLLSGIAAGGEPASETRPETAKSGPPNAVGKKELKLPGIIINREERSLDLEGAVCLREGTLELVACSKDTKEHESIVALDAKPMHIHAALLLLGANPGNPAMRRSVAGQNDRWEEVAPAGSPVDVSLVIEDANKKQIEHPIREFIIAAGDQPEKAAAFPTNTFLFTGSLLVQEGPGPRKYVCDQSGNVISLVTFGDEVLGLPEVRGSDDNTLNWQINDTKLPAVGTRVILRLRPKIQPDKAGQPKSDTQNLKAPSTGNNSSSR